MKLNRFAPGAFVGTDNEKARVDIAWAGACPKCSSTLAIVRDFNGGTLDVCGCGFSRPTPRQHAPPSPSPNKRRVSARAQYWQARYKREQQKRRGAR